MLGSASVAAAAAMLALVPADAQAQAFRANVTGTTGAVTVSRTASTDTVTVSSTEAIINWQPTDTATGAAPIVVLDNGNTLRFTGDANYTVLNRVIPVDQSRAIQFNGLVTSDITGTQGGNVWFYSPGGIILGSTAVFNVGSLLLTTTDLDTSSGLTSASNMFFTGNVGGGTVSIAEGAQVNASNYVVAWAPRVEQAGTVSAGGNVNYVGAEKGTLGLKGPLFDVLIDVGTSDPNGIVHSGTTTGPTGATGLLRSISMISVPKNTFINMLVGGKVGYQEATVAGVSNGVVYLEAGDPFGGGTSASSIDIGTTQFTSDVGAYSSGTITITADGQGNGITVGSAARPVDFTAEALGGITVKALNGGSFDASGNVTLSATNGARGGDITISVQDTSANAAALIDGFLVAGDLTLNAIGNGTGAGAAGGNVSIDVGANADFTVGADLSVDVSAVGLQTANAAMGSDGAAGGAATAGTISITNSGVFSVPVVSLKAAALGGVGGDGGIGFSGGAGGSGTAGNISLVSTTELVGLSSLVATADGTGGAGGDGGAFLGSGTTDGGAGGNGTGGTISLTAIGADAAIQPTADVTLTAAGSGGTGGTGGTNPLDFGTTGNGGAGGIGSGGTISATAARGGSIDLPTTGEIDASATGGDGGQGGTATLVGAGVGGAGGEARGGALALTASGGGAIAAGSSTGTLSLLTTAFGGSGGAGGTGITGAAGQAGAAAAGTVDILADAGTFDVTGNLIADARALGVEDTRDGATGNDATGGSVTVEVANGGALSVTGGMAANVSAAFGIGPNGAGTARAGNVDLLMSGAGSSFDILGQFGLAFPARPRQDSLYVEASAFERTNIDSTSSAPGGNTVGGTVNVDFQDGSSTFASATEFYVSSGAYDRSLATNTGASAINSAIATGGSVSINLANSTNQWGSTRAAVEAFGFGGEAIQGTISLSLDNASLDLTNAGGTALLSLFTYTGGEITVNDPIAVDVSLANGSSLTAQRSISLFGDTGHGTSTNTIHAGGTRMIVDASTVTAGTGISLGNEAQAFRFPSIAPNTTGADALGGDHTFIARNGSIITGNVSLDSFALTDAGPSGGSARSGELTYTLDNSTHVGNISMLSFAEGQGASDVSGTGGSTVGGSQTINIVNGADYTGTVRLETSLYTYHNGVSDGPLGDVTGSPITMTITDSNAAIALLSVEANDGADPTAPGFVGSSVTASDFGLAISGSTVSIDTISSVLSATGGDGGNGATAGGTPGGDGEAGDFIITSDATSSLTLGTADITSDGTGGAGGDGALRASPAASSGGSGGNGTGGSIQITALGDFQSTSLTATAIGAGGAGGAASNAGAAGNGGTGVGGAAILDLTNTVGTSVSVGTFALDASASGGAGGSGGVGDITDPGGAGGAGGSAIGGTALFGFGGDGNSFTFDAGLVSVSADAIGGAGGSGGNNNSGGTAGNGGAGGDATGGTSAIVAGSGSEIVLLGISGGTFDFGATGRGGTGGAGGSNVGVPGTPGSGGDGGTGTGGNPILRAIGGNIVNSDLNLFATGTGGDGGGGGDDGNASFGASGNGGGGVGGTPLLEALEGSPGRLTLGTVVIDASGIAGTGTVTGTTAGGQITLTDASTDPAGLITMSSLTVTAAGTATAVATPSLTIESDSGPITVTGAVNANVPGSIVFNFDGDGQLVAGGNATFIAGGDITLTHTNNTTPVNSIDAGVDLTMTAANGDFSAGDGSNLVAAREIAITAQNIAFDVLEAGNDNIFDAGEFALTLNATAGSITGGTTGSLTAISGVDLDATQSISIGDVAITDGPITIDAGTTLTAGDVTIVQGGLVSNESITINAGGDTVLGNVAAIDGLTVNVGGSLTAASLRGTGITATAAGAVDIGDATIFDGIAGGGGITISGTSVILDSADASTTVGNDIAIDATAGGVTLGIINTEAFLDVNATGDIAFDTLTGTGVFLTTTGGDVTGTLASTDRNVISARPRDVIITATGDVAVTSFSTINDVEVTGATFASDSIVTGNGAAGTASNLIVNVTGAAVIGTADLQGFAQIDAATIDITSGTFQAASTLTSTVGDINFGALSSNLAITLDSAASILGATATGTGTRTIFNENLSFIAVGDVTLTGTIDAKDSVVIDAGGAVDTQQLVADGNVTVTAGTTADIAGITTEVLGTGNTASVTGQSVTVGASTLIGGFVANATAGDVTLTGAITGTSLFDIDATGSLLFSTLTNSGQLQIDVGGAISGDSILKVGTDVLAGQGRLINAGGDITLTGLVDSHDTIQIGGGGAVSIDELLARDSITVNAAGLVDIRSLTTTVLGTGNLASITGSGVTIDTASLVGDLAANATAGDVSLGTVTAAARVDVDATGDIFLTDVTAGRELLTAIGGAGLTADAGGLIDFTDITTTDGDISLTAGGNVTGTNLNASTSGADGGSDSVVIVSGGNVSLTGVVTALDNIDIDAAGSITFDGLDAADQVILDSGAGIIGNTITAVDNVTVTAAGTLDLGDVTTTDGGSVDTATLTGANVILDTSLIFGTLTIDATAGNATLGAIQHRDALNVSATDSITAISATNPGGDAGNDTVTLNAGNDITFTGEITSLDSIVVNAGGQAVLPTLQANENITVTVGGLADIGSVTTLDAGTNDFARITAGELQLDSADVYGDIILASTVGDVTLGAISQIHSLTVNAAGSIFGTSFANSGTDIDNDDVSLTAGDAIVVTGEISTPDSITINAGGLVSTQALNAFDNVTVTAGTSATIASITTTDTGNVSLNAQTISLGASTIDGTLDATSTVGDISFTGLIDTAQATTVDAAANLDFTRIENGNGNLSLAAAGNITGIDAINDAPVGSGGLDRVVINAGGTLTITGTVQSVDDGVFLTSTGNMDIAAIDSADTISAISTGGAVTVASATNANNFVTTLRGIAVTLTDSNLVGNLVLDATGGDVSANGTVTVGGTIDLDATGNIGFGSLASGGIFNADAGGNITFTSAAASGALTFNAGGSVLGGDVTTDQAAADATFNATNAITLGDVTTRILTATAGTDLTVGAVDALGRNIRGLAIDLNAGGAVNFTSLNSGRGIDIDSATVTGGDILADDGLDILAQSISIGNAEILNLGLLSLEATAGNLTTGDLTNTTFAIVARATGDIATGNLLTTGTANASDITVDAGGNATIGDATSGNDLSVDVGGNLVSGNLVSNSASPGTSINVAGDADIGGFNAQLGPASLNIGGALTGGDFAADSTLTFTADSIDVTSATSRIGSVFADTFNGAAIFGSIDAAIDIGIDASGAAEVGTATSGRDTDILGDSVLLDDGTIGGSLSLQATAGDIDGSGIVSVGAGITLDATGNVTFGSLTAQSDVFRVDAGGNISFASAESTTDDLLLTAGGQITGGDVTAGLTASLDAARIVIGNGTAGFIDFASASDILFDSLTSPNAISLTAMGGTIGANTGSGDIDSDGDVTLLSQEIAIGDVTTLGSLDAQATAGDAGFGTVDAANTITISATGTPTVANAISGGNTTVSGSAVTFNSGTIGGDLSLTATGGDIDGNGAVTVGGAITMAATGNVGFGSLEAQGGAFTVDAGGEISFTGASALTDIDFTAGTNILGGDLDAGGALLLSALSISIGNAMANIIDLSTTGDILFDSLSSPNAITLASTEGTIGANTGAGDIDSGGDVALSGNTLAVGDVTSGGSISASAGNGGFTGGVFVAAGDVDGNATGAISIDDITSGGNATLAGTTIALAAGNIGGDLALNATGGDLDATGAITVSGGIDLDATGAITFGTLDAQGGAFTADAGDNIDFTSASGNADLTFNAGGAITGANMDVPNGTITLAAAGAIAIDHAEAGSDFIATGQDNFSTGLNSIITGGDILIDVEGLVDLGNSSAGGLVDVEGAQIDFVTVAAGTTINLRTVLPILTAIGTGDITGTSLTAGAGASSVTSGFGNVAISGISTIGGSFSASAPGNVGIGTIDVQGGDLTVNAGNNASYTTATATGSITMLATGTITGGNAIADQQVRLLSRQQAIDVADLVAGTDIDLDAATDIAAGNLLAGTGIDALAGGGIAVLTAISDTGDIVFNANGGSIAVTGTVPVVVDATGGSVLMSATADILFDGDVSAANIVALTLDGNLTAQDLTAGQGIDVQGDGNANLLLATSANGSVIFDVIGDLSAVTISNLGNGSGNPDDNVLVSAGGTVTMTGASEAFGDYEIAAGGAFTGGDYTAGGALTIGAADVAFGTGIADTISITSGADILFDLLRSPNAITVTANSGRIAANTGAGDIESDGDITLSSIDIALNDLTAGGAVSAVATQAVTLGDVDSSAGTGAIALHSGTDMTVANLISGNTIDLTVGGSLDAGQLLANNTLQRSDIQVDGNAVIDRFETTGNINLTVFGSLTGNEFVGNFVDISAASMDIATAQGSDIGLVTLAGDLSVDQLISTGGALVAATGNATIGSFDLGSGSLLRGANVFLDGGTIDGNLVVAALAGDVVASGPIDVAGLARFEATQDVSLANLATTAGGDVTIDAGRNVDFDLLASSGALDLLAGGAITGGDLTAASSLTLDGNSIAIGAASAADIDLTSATDIRFDLLTSPNAIAVTATNGVISGNTGAGAIDSDGAVSVTALSISLDEILAGGSITAVATNGDLAFQNLISGGTIDLTATNDILADHAEAAVDFFANAGRDFTTGLNSIITGGDIVINSQGIVDLGNSSAGGLVDVTGQQIDFVTVQAGGTIDLLTFFDPQFPVRGNGNITGTDLTSGAGASSSVAVGSVTVGGTSSIGGSLLFQAGTDIAFGTADVQGGDFVADAGGAITYGSATGAGSILFDAGGAIVGGDLTATNTLSLSGADIAIGDGVGNLIIIDSGLDILFDSLTSPNAITLTATNGSIAANTGPGDIDSGGDVSLLAQTIAVGDVTSGGSVDAQATVGDAGFGTIDAANDITVVAAGTPTIANAISGGNTSVTGSSVTFTNGTIGGDLALTATAGDIDANGAVMVGGGIALDATGSVGFGTLVAQSGDFTVSAGDEIVFDTANAAGAIDFDAGGAITGTGDIAAGSTVELASAAGPIAFGDLSAGAGAEIDAAEGVSFGDATLGGALAVNAGGGIGIDNVAGATDITLDAGQAIGFATLAASGAVDLTAGAGVVGDAIDAGGMIDVVSTANGAIAITSLTGGADIEVLTGGSFTASTVTADQAGSGQVSITADNGVTIDTLIGNDAVVNASDGAVAVAGDIDLTGAIGAFGRSVLLRSSNDLVASASATAGNVDIAVGGTLSAVGIDASDDILLTGDTVAAIDTVIAGGLLDIDAATLTDIQGTASGASIDIVTGDIAIGSTGALGSASDTQSIAIAATNDATLGGDGTAGTGFELDNDEFGRIAGAGSMSLVAQGLADPNEPGTIVGGNLTILDLDIGAGSGGQIAQDGSLELFADGDVQVGGAATVAGGSSDTSLQIGAGGLLRIDAAAGNLRIEDGSGNATGAISLAARDVYAVSDAALADIAGLSTEEINERLGENDGILREDGVIQSANLTIGASGGIFIQNTGDGDRFADRRGFTVESLTITDDSDPGVAIVINGKVGGTTGIDTIDTVQIDIDFDSLSTINGCLIVDPASCRAIGTGFDDRVRDLIEDEFEPGEQPGSGIGGIDTVLIEIRDTTEYSDDPLIDDPVTGAGNEDLWTGDIECEAGEEVGGFCQSGEGAGEEEDEELEPAE